MFTSLDQHKNVLSVLYLSQDDFNGSALKEILENIGHMDVVTTVASRQALSHLAERDFDLFITDVALADGDGLALIRQIRSGETAAPRDVTILAMGTPTDFAATEQKLAGLWVNGLVTMPFTLSALAEQIVEALSHHHLGQLAEPPVDEEIRLLNRPSLRSRAPEQRFTLPFGALGEGMYLVEPVTVYGNELVAAGTCLDEDHLMLIERMEHILDGDEAMLSFSQQRDVAAAKTRRSATILEMPKAETGEPRMAELGVSFG